VQVSLASLSNSRGHALSGEGIDIGAALEVLDAGGDLSGVPGAETASDGLAALPAAEPDLLVDVSKSPRVGVPGLSYRRWALESRIPVATSNTWPVALAGVELAALAREQRVGFRAESTVMSGTPLLSALTAGLGGATPQSLRGVVNATVNQICTRMDEGAAYEQALEEAQAAGLAEPDPSEDVDGLDATAKLMILSALVFGEQLKEADVERSGVSSSEGDRPKDGSTRLREVATIDPGAGRRSVEMTEVHPGDPLFDVTGPENAVCLEASPVGRVIVRGPGAGPELAGQGVLSDVLALAREIELAGAR
jgi:homoserine dehydrogenase